MNLFGEEGWTEGVCGELCSPRRPLYPRCTGAETCCHRGLRATEWERTSWPRLWWFSLPPTPFIPSLLHLFPSLLHLFPVLFSFLLSSVSALIYICLTFLSLIPDIPSLSNENPLLSITSCWGIEGLGVTPTPPSFIPGTTHFTNSQGSFCTHMHALIMLPYWYTSSSSSSLGKICQGQVVLSVTEDCRSHWSALVIDSLIADKENVMKTFNSYKNLLQVK